jgi:hypothetical protein
MGRPRTAVLATRSLQRRYAQARPVPICAATPAFAGYWQWKQTLTDGDDPFIPWWSTQRRPPFVTLRGQL